MYGLGFTWRRTRYTSKGSAPSSKSKRVESTTWKMSPARMSSLRGLHRRRVHGLGHRARRLGQRFGGIGRFEQLLAERRGQVGRHLLDVVARLVVRGVELRASVVGPDHDVVDQHHTLAPVVESGQLTNDRKHRVGMAQIVLGHPRQPLDLPDHVVAHVPDHTPVQGRKRHERRRSVHRQQRFEGSQHPLVTGDARRQGSLDPDLPSLGHKRRRRSPPHEGEAAPALAVLH